MNFKTFENIPRPVLAVVPLLPLVWVPVCLLRVVYPRGGLSTRVRFPSDGESVSGRGEARLVLGCASSLERSSRSLLTRFNAVKRSLVVGMYFVGAIDSSPAYRIGSRIPVSPAYRCGGRWIGVNPPENESPTKPGVVLLAGGSVIACVSSLSLERDSKYTWMAVSHVFLYFVFLSECLR